MTTSTIFYTQIASIVTFVGTLFILYRVLIKQKDATIELLKEKENYLKEKLASAESEAPDILVERLRKRAESLESELGKALSEQNIDKQKIDELQEKLAKTEKEFESIEPAVERAHASVQRFKRHSSIRKYIDKLYGGKCQICQSDMGNNIIQIVHIKPLTLGGEQGIENILCLCPNHHMMYDSGQLIINEDLSLEGTDGSLYVHPDHKIDKESLKYHREKVYKTA